jgi:hypothetical protein
LRKESATDPIAHTSMKTSFPPGPGHQARGKAKAKRAKERKEKARREKVKERKEKERGKEKEKTKARKAKEKVKRIVAKASLNSGVQLASQPVTHGRTVGRIKIVNSHGTIVAKVAKVARVVNHGELIRQDLCSINKREVIRGVTLSLEGHVTALNHRIAMGYPICVQTSKRDNVSLGTSVVTPIMRTGDRLDQVHHEVTEDQEHHHHT